MGAGWSKAVISNRVAVAAEDNADSMKPPPLMKHGGNEQERNIYALPARSACEAMVLEQARRQMQAAATRGDYILSGKLQATLVWLLTLWQGMQQAAQQGDFILAGHLQTQMNAFMESDAKEMATVMTFDVH